MQTQPATVACKDGSSVGTRTRCTFLRVLRRLVTLGRCLLTKFLHRSSGGGLLRVRCWLGKRERKEIRAVTHDEGCQRRHFLL